MRFIHKLAYSSARYIQTELYHSHEKRAVLYFGFQAIFGDAWRLFIIISISLVLKSFLPSLLIAVTFAYLRRNAGGIHMNTASGCTIFTTCICVIPGTIINYFSLRLTPISVPVSILSIFVFCYICLLKYAPKDCVNRPITDANEIQKFKYKSILTLKILLLVSTFFIFLGKYKLAISIGVGSLVEVFTIIPIVCKSIERKR